MIELGLHTDNLRTLSGSFQAAAEMAVRHGLKQLEFQAIHGQYFLQTMGYEPGISLQSNPRRLFFGPRLRSSSSRPRPPFLPRAPDGLPLLGLPLAPGLPEPPPEGRITRGARLGRTGAESDSASPRRSLGR